MWPARATKRRGFIRVICNIRFVSGPFAGTWRFEPDQGAIRMMPLGPDTAHIYAPIRIKLGPPGGQSATYPDLVNEIAIRTPNGWRNSAIIPVPAP
jgi:hypothetical protein